MKFPFLCWKRIHKLMIFFVLAFFAAHFGVIALTSSFLTGIALTFEKKDLLHFIFEVLKTTRSYWAVDLDSIEILWLLKVKKIKFKASVKIFINYLKWLKEKSCRPTQKSRKVEDTLKSILCRRCRFLWSLLVFYVFFNIFFIINLAFLNSLH